MKPLTRRSSTNTIIIEPTPLSEVSPQQHAFTTSRGSTVRHRRKRKRAKTASARAEECPDDLVEREFAAPAPNCRWVADIPPQAGGTPSYVPTSAGWAYTTFILDVFHREIVGWQVTNHMRESLARDALTMALAAKYRAGEDVSGLVHHSDRGVQFRSIRYGETLAESEVVASVASRGGVV